MRLSQAKAAENRLRVIDVASRLFREHGFNGIGLNGLMKGAGLTQGGFYKQFKSKEDLAAHASARAMQRAIKRWSTAASANPAHPFAAMIDFYFSGAHRDDVEDGCPLVSLGADASRHGQEVGAAFREGIEEHLDILCEHMPPGDAKIQRSKAMTVLSTMVGALLLSRAVGDPSLSQDFLTSGAEEVRRSTKR